MGQITGTLTLGNLNNLCTSEFSMVLYRLYAIGAAEPSGSRLLRKSCYIVVVASDL